MNCRRVEQLLFDDREGLRRERDSIALAAHLAHCPACRRRRDAYTSIRTELHGLSTLPPPPPHLTRRAIDRWALEQSVRLPSHDSTARRNAATGMFGRPTIGLSLAATLAFLAVAVLTISRLHHSPPSYQTTEVASGDKLRLPRRGPTSPVKDEHVTAGAKSVTHSAMVGRDRGRGRERAAERNSPRSVPSPPGLPGPLPPRDEKGAPKLAVADRGDDLRYLNGPDPVENVRPWAPVAQDEWDAIEAKVRREVRVRDDFVQVPFVRIAGTAEEAVVAAVEQYKREAAIVDPRLFHEVTLAQKAMALSDLCDHLRGDTGIQLAAGPSVADEKVTIFCEKQPLRDVMRQLSRPLGFTWLRSGKPGDYRYELVQDLRSQLAEEALRNRDRDQALLALERDVDRYRPYLGMSPGEALARAKTAPPGDKPLLERLAGEGWGPIHLYFRLSPREQEALRMGQELRFSQEPQPGELPLPSDLARPVLECARHVYLARREGALRPAGPSDADAMPLTAVPEARALVTLSLHQSELGRFNLGGASGYELAGANMTSLTGDDAYAVGTSPTVREPDNAAANASFAHDPALRARVTVAPGMRDEGKGVRGGNTASGSANQNPNAQTRGPAPRFAPPPEIQNRLTSADVLEALHRATGLPIVSDFYTRLYPHEETSTKDEPLFDALNHLADAMRLRWHKDGNWLQFRSASYYDDRLKEVPNRLLARWAASRRAHGALTLDDLIEIAQLSDQQLDAASMAEGAREIWGLEEWGLARGSIPRRHLRFLAQCTPEQRRAATSPGGLAFDRMSLAEQQQFISLAFAYSPAAYTTPPPDVRLEDLTGASLHVRYSLPGGFEWQAASETERPADELSVLWAPTRDAALEAARRLDPQVGPAQIVPSERSLTFLYTHGDPKAGRQAVAVRATPSGVTISGS